MTVHGSHWSGPREVGSVIGVNRVDVYVTFFGFVTFPSRWPEQCQRKPSRGCIISSWRQRGGPVCAGWCVFIYFFPFAFILTITSWRDDCVAPLSRCLLALPFGWICYHKTCSVSGWVCASSFFQKFLPIISGFRFQGPIKVNAALESHRSAYLPCSLQYRTLTVT